MITETHTFEDPQLVAFLSLPLFNFTITPQLTPTGRVAFAVAGSQGDIDKALHSLMNDTPVGSRSLLEAIKKTRTKMFLAKQAGQLEASRDRLPMSIHGKGGL